MVAAAEASEPTKEAETTSRFFALDRRVLDSEGWSFPSLFGEAFRSEIGVSASSSSSRISRDFFLVSGAGAGPEIVAGEAGAFAPTRFQTGQQIAVPAGFCRTRQCKALVVVGAGVAGGGAALIATGGEANRKLGMALVLGGCGLIILVLLLD